MISGIVGYKAYRPNLLPPFPEIEMDAEMVNLLSKAHNYLGKLEMTSKLIPDMKLFFLIKVKDSLFSIKKNSSLWMIHFLLF